MAERARSTQRSVAEDAASAAESLGGKTAAAIERAGEAGSLGGAAGELKGAASDIKAAAAEHGRHLYESAKVQATGFADQRKDATAKSVSDLAATLRESGKTFDDRPNIKAFVSTAADGLEQLADGIKNRSFAEIYADVEDYARRSPVTVGAVAAAAGFLLARFIKSSSDDMSKASAEVRRGPAPRTSRRRASSPLDA